MNEQTSIDAYGVLIEPATLRIQRLLPGPVERVWSYLTQSDLRAKWLASGDMELKAGAPFKFTWRNSELTDPPGDKPDGFGEEHSLDSEITELQPLRRLGFTWGSTGGVTFELEPQGDMVLLTVTHQRVTERSMLLGVSAGWHAHLDVLAARLANRNPAPFWNSWSALRGEYEGRIGG